MMFFIQERALSLAERLFYFLTPIDELLHLSAFCKSDTELQQLEMTPLFNCF